MNFPELIIENFLAIGHARLELDNRGLLAIQGVNKDDSSASSNGAAKSSIVDALCWCFYGVTARDVSGDGVVNRKAKKDCSVIARINDDGTVYRVERYRKHSKLKNQLFIFREDADPTMPDTDLSKGTDAETQLVVRQVLGCSLDVFLGAIYAGQEKMPDLPGMTDKHLKLLIEEASGTEELAEAYKIAARMALDAEKDYKIAATHLKSVEQRYELLNDEYAEAVTEHRAYEDSRRDRAQEKLKEVLTIKPMLERATTARSLIDTTALNTRYKNLQTELLTHRAQQDKLATMERSLNIAKRDLAVRRAEYKRKRGILDSMVRALKDIDNSVGKPCTECGKPYAEHDLAAVRDHQKKSLIRLRDELTAEASLVGAMQGQVDNDEEAVEAYRKTMTDVTAVTEEAADIQTQTCGADALDRSIADMQHDITDIKRQAKQIMTMPNPWQKAIEDKQRLIHRTEKELDASQASLTTLQEQFELFADAAKVFGPAGVRAHILDTVTPTLNEKTNDYLAALSDGHIHAVWSTLSTTSKGELKEKFNIAVTHDLGGENFKALSGGEKRKVRIATNMALQDLVASRAEKPIDLWIGDEIDHALDEPGLERLMSVLDRKAKERGTVLVISHNALSDWIDQVITVTKDGGTSSVDGATCHGF